MKTSIFEDPRNYDSYFGNLKNEIGPNLAGISAYVLTFESFLPGAITAVSGAAISINLIGGNQVLKVEQLVNEDAYIKIPLVTSVSGSAITFGAVSGSSITIRVSMLYDETTASPTGFHMGMIESSGSDEAVILLESSYETVVGQNKDKWIVLSAKYIFSGKDTYLYFKGTNLSTYYIDNIIIKD